MERGMMSAISEAERTAHSKPEASSEMCAQRQRALVCSDDSNLGPGSKRKRHSLATPSLASSNSSSSSNSAQNLVQQSCLSASPDAELCSKALLAAESSFECAEEAGRLPKVLFAAASSLGNKCGKCQNHEVEISKKGHARDCPFKKCDCLKCRLLDARSDILQVISGKETKLKGTKKDPNCGFCQNHGIKILRKGHVRSCHFGQERHFRLDNCFDCEVHYIRNEVNRLQIKMRRAMKEDRTLSEEQRKTAREAITRDEVEKVCDMARMARKKREGVLKAQQVALDVGESSGVAGAGNARSVQGASIIQPRAPRNSPTLAPFASAAQAAFQQQMQQRQHSSTTTNQLAEAGLVIKSERKEISLLGAHADELDGNSSLSGDELAASDHQHQMHAQMQHQMQQGHLSNLVIHNRASHLAESPAGASQSALANNPVWRPWSQQRQQQIVAALAAQHQHQPQASQHSYMAASPPQLITNTNAIDASADSLANFNRPLRTRGGQPPPAYLTANPMAAPFQPGHAPTGAHLTAISMDSQQIVSNQQQQQQTPLEQQQLLYTIFRVLFDNLHQQQQQQSQHFNMP